MKRVRYINFGFGPSVPVLIQSETTECGLACVGMIAGYYGARVDMLELRRKFPISMRGVNLAQVIKIASDLNLTSRPVKVELEDLKKMQKPCVLHWSFTHFVVLVAARRKYIVVHDPSLGRRRYSYAEASKHFTGIALELWPSLGFEKGTFTYEQAPWSALIGKVSGLYTSLAHIATLAVILELLYLLSPQFLQWTIDAAVAMSDTDLLGSLAIGFGGLLVMQSVFSLARSWSIMHLGTTLSLQWRANVLSHLLRLPLTYFEKRSVADITTRLNSIDRIQEGFTTSFINAFLDGCMAVITLTLVFVYDVELGLIVLAFFLALAIVNVTCYKYIYDALLQEILHNTAQQGCLLESIRAIKAVKLFQREDVREANWLTHFAKQINASVKGQKLKSILDSAKILLPGLGTIAIVYFSAASVLRGEFTVGALMAIYAYKRMFDDRSSVLIEKYFLLRSLRVWADRLSDIVLTEKEAQPTTYAYVDSNDSSVSVKNLSFRYSEFDRYVLNDVSFEVNTGESVAIKGASGEGKSTLVNLLLGVLPPSDGEIFIGGINITAHGSGQARSFISAVLQDDSLLSGTIGDNISFSDPDPDQRFIEECAKVAAIHDDIMAMPMRYNSLIGDMGTSLSGGQKQRILLARALYRRPRILLLDEATSHLDPQLEKVVSDAVRSLKLTRIIIAHRAETISTAERCLTLSGGTIVEEAFVVDQPVCA